MPRWAEKAVGLGCSQEGRRWGNSWAGVGGDQRQAARAWPAENREAERAPLRGQATRKKTEELLLAAPPMPWAQGVSQGFPQAQRQQVDSTRLVIGGSRDEEELGEG